MNKVVYAKTYYVRRSPRKTRLVLDMIRGMSAVEALDTLKFVNKGAAADVGKTLKSAIANAEHNDKFDKKTLFVLEAFVNEAPTFKRGRAVSKGRYHQILKRNSHIIIGVGQNESETKTKPERKTVAKPKTTIKAAAKKPAAKKAVKKL